MYSRRSHITFQTAHDALILFMSFLKYNKKSLLHYALLRAQAHSCLCHVCVIHEMFCLSVHTYDLQKYILARSALIQTMPSQMFVPLGLQPKIFLTKTNLRPQTRLAGTSPTSTVTKPQCQTALQTVIIVQDCLRSLPPTMIGHADTGDWLHALSI